MGTLRHFIARAHPPIDSHHAPRHTQAYLVLRSRP
jgi:hypothetical protein